MVLDARLDVALEPRLRPAALVVAARLLLEVVGDLLQAAAAEPEQLSLLAPDEGDDRPVAAPKQRHERS